MFRLPSASFVLTALVIAAGCTVDTGPEDVSGSGRVVLRTFDLEEFDQIDISGAFGANVIVAPDDAQTVEITADDTFFDDIEVEVFNRVLRIAIRDGVTFDEKTELSAHISVASLRKVRAAEASDVEIDAAGTHIGLLSAVEASKLRVSELDGVDISLDAMGASQVELAGVNVVRIGIEAAGASQVDLSELPAEEASVNISGASEVTLGRTPRVEGNVDGASTLGVPRATEVVVETSGESVVERY